MDVYKVLKTAWFTPGLNGRWGLPLLFEGSPGVGKSRRIEGVGEGCSLPVTTLIASLREPTDFGGLPIPSQQGKQTFVDYAPPGWAADLAADERGVVFVDEITTCAPAVQAALLRMILDGALGDFTLPAGVRFVAAANAVAEAAGGWDLAAPLANRFGHVRWESPTPQQWTEWLIGSDSTDDETEATVPDPVSEEQRVMAAWPKAYAMAKGSVASFIKSRGELLFKMPDAGSAQASKAWPSHRTWEMATRALAGADVHGLDAMSADELLAAFVGAGPAGEFLQYTRTQDLPDPEDLLDGKVPFKHDARRLDRTMAIFSSCSAYITSTTEKKKARASKLWEMIKEAVDNDAGDVAVPAAKVLVTNKFHKLEAAQNVLEEIYPLLQAAGMTRR